MSVFVLHSYIYIETLDPQMNSPGSNKYAIAFLSSQTSPAILFLCLKLSPIIPSIDLSIMLVKLYLEYNVSNINIGRYILVSLSLHNRLWLADSEWNDMGSPEDGGVVPL